MAAPAPFSRASRNANRVSRNGHREPRDTSEPQSPPPQPHAQGRWGIAPLKASDAGEGTLSWEVNPPLWRRLVRGLSVPAAVGILLFLVALGVTAAMVLRSLGGGGTDTVEGLGPEQHAGAGQTAGTGAGEAAAVPGEEAVPNLVVHLVGEVQRPGVVELPAGARVLDAIEAAGGVTDLADLTALNLAREVSDGEQIQVFDTATAARLREQGGGVVVEAVPEANRGGGAADGLVNVNTASVEQLLKVSGIGEKTLDRFRDRVRV